MRGDIPVGAWSGMEDGSCGCVIGVARLGRYNPIRYRNSMLMLSIIFIPGTGVVRGVEVDSFCDITKRVVSDILCGRSLYSDRGEIFDLVNRRYHGASKQMLTIAIMDAINKIKSRNPGKKENPVRHVGKPEMILLQTTEEISPRE